MLAEVVDKLGILPYPSRAVVEEKDVLRVDVLLLVDNSLKRCEGQAKILANHLTIMIGVGIDGNRNYRGQIFILDFLGEKLGRMAGVLKYHGEIVPVW